MTDFYTPETLATIDEKTDTILLSEELKYMIIVEEKTSTHVKSKSSYIQ